MGRRVCEMSTHRYTVKDNIAVFEVSKSELDTVEAKMRGWNPDGELVKWLSTDPKRGRFGDGHIEQLDDHYTISLEQKDNHFLIIMVDNILTGDMK
jgi:hypothetical protein